MFDLLLELAVKKKIKINLGYLQIGANVADNYLIFSYTKFNILRPYIPQHFLTNNGINNL